jgi:hypothetical protein
MATPEIRRRVLEASQVLVFLAAVWLVWLGSAEYRSAGNSLGLLVCRAAAYELIVWALAAGIALWVYLAISMADFSRLLFASLSATAPVAWLAPAILLLSVQTGVTTAAGIVLTANAARLVVLNRHPRGFTLPQRQTHRTAGPPALFRLAAGETNAAAPLLPILAAVALHGGIFAILASYPLASGALFAAGAALGASESVRRGASQPHTGRILPHALLSFALTLLLITGFAAARLGPSRAAAAPAGFLKEAQGFLKKAARSTNESRPAPEQSAVGNAGRTQTIGSVDGRGFAGAILRPGAPRRGQVWIALPPVRRIGRTFSRPFTIPFTGEYRLFPSLLGRMPENYFVFQETPLEGVYATLSGTPLDTQAYQPLSPPVDFADCAGVQMVMASGDDRPGLAIMELICGRQTKLLGGQVYGKVRGARETLEFVVPVPGRALLVGAIRVTFERARRLDLNAKVAVKEFTLIPRQD